MSDWQKSSFSSGGDACVELEQCGSDVAIRNSRQPTIALIFTYEEISAFIDGVRAGEFYDFNKA